MHGEHLLREVHRTVAGRLGAHLGAAPLHALAGEHARLVPVGDLAVLAEEVADLARAHADVARRHIGVLAQVPVELVHERLAEAHDLGIRSTVRIEVAAALGAADALAGQGVLEDLLEAEELDDRQVHRRVEAQPALVGAEHRRELHAEAAVDLQPAGVVDPRHAEDDLALRLDEPLQDAVLDELRVRLEHRCDRLEHLVDGLEEFRLVGVARHDGVEHVADGRGSVKEGERHGGAFVERGSGPRERAPQA